MQSNSIFNATVCIMGILILSVHFVYLLQKKDKRRDERVLMDFFAFTVIHFATYLSYTIIKHSYTSDKFVIAFYTTFYIMNNLEVFLLFRYAREYIKIDKKQEKIISRINLGFFSLFILLDILNIFTGIFFSASGGEYVRSKWMFFSQGYEFGAFAAVCLIAARSKRLDWREKAAFWLYCLLPLVAIILQNIFKGYAIGYASIIFSIELLFLFLNVQRNMVLAEKVTILDSMAGIYDNVNLIDFINSTETNLRTAEQNSTAIDMSKQSHTLMNQELKNNVHPEQYEKFIEFTNIKTVRKRLTNKKIISADFIDVSKGWFRAQYITVDETIDGVPNVVIYTTRNIDDEKQREETLIKISMTDDMTRLFNRRCYDEDLNSFKTCQLEKDFVIFSIDVNGLKKVNDTMGHSAGDEIVKGAADCLSFSFSNHGKVYRTGGDEFMAIINTDTPEKYREMIHAKADEWKGAYSDKLSVSVGYASVAENGNISVEELERLADMYMYKEKEKYYKESGNDRRIGAAR